MGSAVTVKCWQAFEDKLSTHKWMKSEIHYKTHRALVQTEIYDSCLSRFAAANEQKLITHFRTALERCGASYKARKAHLAMPVSEGDLEAEHNNLATSVREALDEQAGHAGDLKDTDAYSSVVKSLQAILDEGGQYARQKNVELWKVHSDEATRCALLKNQAVLRQCGLLCFFNKVPGIHKSTCQQHLQKCLAASSGSGMSPQMQLQVFENWYIKDLAHDASTVWNNFYIGSALLGLLLILACTAMNRCQQPPQQAYGMGNFDPYSNMPRDGRFSTGGAVPSYGGYGVGVR